MRGVAMAIMRVALMIDWHLGHSRRTPEQREIAKQFDVWWALATLVVIICGF